MFEHRSNLENTLRRQPGYIEALERDAADPSHAVHFPDWENPNAPN